MHSCLPKLRFGIQPSTQQELNCVETEEVENASRATDPTEPAIDQRERVCTRTACAHMNDWNGTYMSQFVHLISRPALLFVRAATDVTAV